MSTFRRLRCAVYTRKSSDEGLDQEFNSLDAQREACAAFIASQVGLGWKLVPEHYDDGGISGGTMDRPALKRLLADITAQQVDVVVVYKIDRLTRSLGDFARIVEVFDGNGVSFVSVTQQFNTTTSMGRLTLNVLLSFAQFEREVTAERIRDKIAASKKKGMWMGGTVPLGYRVDNRKLLVKEPEATFVRGLFIRYLELRSVPALATEMTRQAQDAENNDASRPGWVFTRRVGKGMLYTLLSNPIYVGKLRHRHQVYDGEHPAIIDPDLFDQVQAVLEEQAATPRGSIANPDSHLLTGLLFDDIGDRMSPTHARAHGKRYHYYISSRIKGTRVVDNTAWRVPASRLDAIVLRAVTQFFADRPRLADSFRSQASSADVKRWLSGAAELNQRLANADAPARRSLIRSLLTKVVLRHNAIMLEISTDALINKLHTSGTDHRSDVDQDEEHTIRSITCDVPVAIERRGIEMRLVIENDQGGRTPDAALVDLIAKAHLYLRHLTSGPKIGVSDVARHFGVDRVDVGRILPLAFLAPRVTRQFLSGDHAGDQSPRRLARTTLPMLWSEHDAALR
jgi:DNA invertase Pin-like site-specific DNA recombinase